MKRKNTKVLSNNVTMYGKEKWHGSGNPNDYGGHPTWESGNGYGSGCSDGSGTWGYSQTPAHWGY